MSPECEQIEILRRPKMLIYLGQAIAEIVDGIDSEDTVTVCRDNKHRSRGHQGSEIDE
jgi:hypothetical protein